MTRFSGLQQFNRCWIRAALVLSLTVLVGGCMRVSRAPITPPHWMGSPAVPGSDPFLQPQMGQPTPVPANIPPIPDENPQPTFEDTFSAPVPVESNRVPAPLELPSSESYPSEAEVNPNVQPPRLEAPTIVPQAVTVPPTLSLTVNAPENNLVGEVSVFQVTLRNTGDQAAEDVVIESRFEEAFVFPGSSDRQVNQSIGTLGPGDSREIKLSLQSDRAGHHCVEFSLVGKSVV